MNKIKSQWYSLRKYKPVQGRWGFYEITGLTKKTIIKMRFDAEGCYLVLKNGTRMGLTYSQLAAEGCYFRGCTSSEYVRHTNEARS